jgi:hypothetical protein
MAKFYFSSILLHPSVFKIEKKALEGLGTVLLRRIIKERTKAFGLHFFYFGKRKGRKIQVNRQRQDDEMHILSCQNVELSFKKYE